MPFEESSLVKFYKVAPFLTKVTTLLKVYISAIIAPTKCIMSILAFSKTLSVTT